MLDLLQTVQAHDNGTARRHRPTQTDIEPAREMHHGRSTSTLPIQLQLTNCLWIDCCPLIVTSHS